MIIYHIGRRPPRPREHFGKFLHHWPSMDEPGAFFSPRWEPVWYCHLGCNRQNLHLYRYECPRAIIRRAGGFRRYDSATEVYIPQSLWGGLRFLGGEELGRGEANEVRSYLTPRMCDSSPLEPKTVEILWKRISAGLRKVEDVSKRGNRALILQHVEGLRGELRKMGG